MKKTPPTTPPTMAPTGADFVEAFLEGIVEGSRKELVRVEVSESVDGPVGVEVGESLDEGEENESVSYVLDSLGYPIGYWIPVDIPLFPVYTGKAIGPVMPSGVDCRV